MEHSTHIAVIEHNNGDFQMLQDFNHKALEKRVLDQIEQFGGEYVCYQICSLEHTKRVIEMIGCLYGVEFNSNGLGKKEVLQ